MDSGIKLVLDENELSVVIKAAFGEHAGISSVHELKDGWFNSAYSIVLDTGKKVVLKVAPLNSSTGVMRYEHNVMRAEVDVLKLIQQTGGIPVPEVLFYDDSCSVIEGEYFIMEYLSGEPYNKVKEALSPEQREKIELELGRLNRLINEIKGERFGYFSLEEQHGENWTHVFMAMVAGLLADAKDANVSLPAAAEDVMAAIERHSSSLEEVTIPCLVHWDLWDGNVFVDDGDISGLIDCERALWGDPLMEYYFRTSANCPAFMQGYGIQEMTTAQKKRLMMYDLYLDLILHIECTYRQYSDPNHLQWAEQNLQQSWDRFKSLDI
ncbi:phosphotransferase family protein [Paenibacillus segetis]|uniref:Aminoglycoside phosphotransferase n=1 Tax=Paenibacillus segetis TaxID=1325360 RepID=A0ABQ1YKG6_9BACL|nr:aminoglycoside phosphotransferase family protein [Paenibacillus segetis]GGH28259.1 aminoglycoside phosphotransferase [Paenibacillus segetis]